MVELMTAHEPAEPFWYLRQIGVDPRLQRQRHGAALQRAGLDEIDRRGDPAYLVATTPAGRSLYERQGFSTLTEIQAGNSPPLWPMLRAVAGHHR